MRPDDVRPDPTRGREVLDAIDRFKARGRAERVVISLPRMVRAVPLASVIPVAVPAAPPIKFEADEVARWGSSPCVLCGNALGGTKKPKATLEGYMHPRCERRWFRLSVSERAHAKHQRDTCSVPLAGRVSA